MQAYHGNKVVFFDTDDTLINYNPPYGENTVKVVCQGKESLVNVITQNTRELMRHKNQGQTIVVWSNAGSQWAEAVIKALQLEAYVDIIICKPAWFYDDMPAEKWMGNPRWGGDRR